MLCASVCWAALKISNRRRRRRWEGALVGREECRVGRFEQGGEEEREERDTAEGARRRWVNNLNGSRRGRGGYDAETTRERDRDERWERTQAQRQKGEESEIAVCAW